MNILLGKQPNHEVMEDEDEWYGLEYTLEMSKRASSGSAGESSRVCGYIYASLHVLTSPMQSRELWPALQDDSDEVAYKEWQRWRTDLDYRRAIEYDAYSKDMAWWYVEERKLWKEYYRELVSLVHIEPKCSLNEGIGRVRLCQ